MKKTFIFVILIIALALSSCSSDKGSDKFDQELYDKLMQSDSADIVLDSNTEVKAARMKAY